jgi:hypothetical protein
MFIPLHISSILVWYVPHSSALCVGNCRCWPAGQYTGLLCAAAVLLLCCCALLCAAVRCCALLCAAVRCCALLCAAVRCCCVLVASSYPAGGSHHLMRCKGAVVRSETEHETITFVLQDCAPAALSPHVCHIV